MPQVIEQLGSISGRIGKGFAKGLSEGLPKEIERGRLSSGLKNLSKKDLGGMSLLEREAEIQNIPGMTPEIAQRANLAVQNQAFMNRNKNQGGQTQGSTSLKQGEQRNQPGNAQAGEQKRAPEPVEAAKPNEAGFHSPAEIRRAKENTLSIPDQGAIDDLAGQYLSSGMTQDYGTARQIAAQELAQNIQAQNNRVSEFDTDFNKKYALNLQGTGLGDYKDLPGELQDGLAEQGRYLVREKGMAPLEASDKMNAIALNLAKTSNKTKKTGSFNNMFRPSKDKTSDLRSQKKDFEKYGFGDIFNDFAASQMGITRLEAAHVLSPLNNPKVSDALGKISKGAPHQEKKTPQKELDSLIKSISPKDNLYSIMYEIRKKNNSVNQFIQRVREMRDNGDIVLGDRQKDQSDSAQKEQAEATVSNSLLGDVLYESF